jgi:hypothetical protein
LCGASISLGFELILKYWRTCPHLSPKLGENRLELSLAHVIAVWVEDTDERSRQTLRDVQEARFRRPGDYSIAVVYLYAVR